MSEIKGQILSNATANIITKDYGSYTSFHSKGSAQTRIHFKGIPSDETTYDLAVVKLNVKSDQKPKALGLIDRHRYAYMKVSEGKGSTTWVKVNLSSLKKRFNLSKKDLAELKEAKNNNDGDITDFVKSRAEKLNVRIPYKGGIYEGTLRNGVPHAEKGKFTSANGIIFEGKFSNGKQDPTGKYTTLDGSEFIGRRLANGKDGIGFLKSSLDKKVYQGSVEFSENKMNKKLIGYILPNKERDTKSENKVSSPKMEKKRKLSNADVPEVNSKRLSFAEQSQAKVFHDELEESMGDISETESEVDKKDEERKKPKIDEVTLKALKNLPPSILKEMAENDPTLKIYLNRLKEE